MIDKERGLLLLGSGLGPSDVAETLGCDPSYISQWLMDDEFRARVLAERIKALTAQTERDKRIDSIEDTLIQKLIESVQWLTKPKDILLAFNILNAAKRRGAGVAGGSISITQQVVSINMPATARGHFFPKMNGQGEVVQVGDQVTVTKSLQQLMRERTEKVITDGTRKEAAGGSSSSEDRAEAAT